MFSESTSIPSGSFRDSTSKSFSLLRRIFINTALSLFQKLSTSSNVRVCSKDFEEACNVLKADIFSIKMLKQFRSRHM